MIDTIVFRLVNEIGEIVCQSKHIGAVLVLDPIIVFLKPIIDNTNIRENIRYICPNMARDNGINSTAIQLEEWIFAQPEGALILPQEVPVLAPRKTINNLLAMLALQHKLERIAAGIYYKPEYHPQLGMLRPSVEVIAKAISRRDGARIIPTGPLALNKLGLSTQVPLRIVYLTDGSPRIVKIGNGEIRFRKANLKLLSIKGELSLLVMLALKELGIEGLDDEAKKKIIHALQQEPMEILLHDARLVPAWMQGIFHEAIKIKGIK